jgi:hypothetical protein
VLARCLLFNESNAARGQRHRLTADTVPDNKNCEKCAVVQQSAYTNDCYQILCSLLSNSETKGIGIRDRAYIIYILSYLFKLKKRHNNPPAIFIFNYLNNFYFNNKSDKIKILKI